MSHFLNFVEEIIMNENYQGYRAGRIEVYDNETDRPFSDEEIRFFTDDVKGYYKFQDKYDFKDVSKETLEKVREIATNQFNKNKD